MHDKDTDLATAALRDPGHPAASVESARAGRATQPESGRDPGGGLSDTGMLRALRGGRVPTLDELRLLSGQIRAKRTQAEK